MLQFLTPLWLLALPLTALPWIWPKIHRPTNVYWFSSFFLFPETQHRKKFLFSKDEWLVKLLRTLIILLIVLILARPFWNEQGDSTLIWVIDDTISLSLFPEAEQEITKIIPSFSSQDVWRLSELLPRGAYTPTGNSQETEFAAYSPTLPQIETLIMERLGEQKPSGGLEVHLVSDFQSGQFRFYQNTTENIDWTFHQITHNPLNNLAMRALELHVKGLFQFSLQGELFGNQSIPHTITIQVTQQGQVLVEQAIPWLGKPVQPFDIVLPNTVKRLVPLEVELIDPLDEATLDNRRYLQWNQNEQWWAAIITSEGSDGVYRHGLHQLKAALNANHVFSYLITDSRELEQQPPDILYLLGDHPIRWAEALETVTPKLYIPTRLGDWREFAVQYDASSDGGSSIDLPDKQWFVDWEQVSFSSDWQIRRVSPYLFYSDRWNLWLLATGISPAWGPLYQDVVFANLMSQWGNQFVAQEKEQYLGTFESREHLSQLEGASTESSQWQPGHYTFENPSLTKQFHFSVNYPYRESLTEFFATDEVVRMQEYFRKKAQSRAESLASPSIKQFREWLLWITLGMVLAELSYVFIRLYRSPHSKTFANDPSK